MAKILIVDHDQDFLEQRAARLTNEGHEVDTCMKAGDVPRLVATGGYAMLLLDVSMPGLNAEDLLALLRNLKSTSQTRVIVWSDGEDDGPRTLAKTYEAEYINKGANPTEFAGLVRHSFNSRPPGLPD